MSLGQARKRKEEREDLEHKEAKHKKEKRCTDSISNPGQTNGREVQDRGPVIFTVDGRQGQPDRGSGAEAKGEDLKGRSESGDKRMTIRGTEDERVLRRERGEKRSHDNKMPVYPQSSNVTGEPAVMSGWRSCRFRFANAIFSARDSPKN